MAFKAGGMNSLLNLNMPFHQFSINDLEELLDQNDSAYSNKEKRGKKKDISV